MDGEHSNWLTIAIVALFGGIVSNIIKPKRRGVLGFLAAGIISVFCGGVSGICSSVFGMGMEGQMFIAAIVGVSSDRILTMLLCMDEQVVNNYNSTTYHNEQNGEGSINSQADGGVNLTKIGNVVSKEANVAGGNVNKKDKK